MATYSKNQFKKDKRIANKRQIKQAKKLYNAMSNAQHAANVLELAKQFMEVNKDFNFTKKDCAKIIHDISSEISPFPLSPAILSFNVMKLEEFLEELMKNKTPKDNEA